MTQVLLKERNVGLAERLLQLLRAEDRTVAAIGVMHLLGPGVCLMLLKTLSMGPRFRGDDGG